MGKLNIVPVGVVKVTEKQVRIGTLSTRGRLVSPLAFHCRTVLTPERAAQYATTPKQAVLVDIAEQKDTIRYLERAIEDRYRHLKQARARLKRIR